MFVGIRDFHARCGSRGAFYLSFDGLVRRVARSDGARAAESARFYLVRD